MHKELESNAKIDRIVLKIWAKYDIDGNGVLDAIEARKFIFDIV